MNEWKLFLFGIVTSSQFQCTRWIMCFMGDHFFGRNPFAIPNIGWFSMPNWCVLFDMPNVQSIFYLHQNIITLFSQKEETKRISGNFSYFLPFDSVFQLLYCSQNISSLRCDLLFTAAADAFDALFCCYYYYYFILFLQVDLYSIEQNMHAYPKHIMWHSGTVDFLRIRHLWWIIYTI